MGVVWLFRWFSGFQIGWSLGSRLIFQGVRSCTFFKTQPKKTPNHPIPTQLAFFPRLYRWRSLPDLLQTMQGRRDSGSGSAKTTHHLSDCTSVLFHKKTPPGNSAGALFGMVKWLLQRLSDLQIGHKKYKKVTLNHLAERINCDWWCYLEDHPRYRIWLGSPPFISHGVRPFGKGPRTRSLGDLLTITIVSNYLRYLGPDPPSIVGVFVFNGSDIQIHMEPKNAGLEDDVPFQFGWFFRFHVNFHGRNSFSLGLGSNSNN